MTTRPPTPAVTLGGWIYPGPPACSALSEIADGRSIQVIKPEFFTLQESGALSPITNVECNGYTPENVAAMKAGSQQQFVTVSGTIAGIVTLASDSTLLSTCVNTLISFLQTTGFTGVEFDIEDFGSWSAEYYQDYKTVMNTIGAALHQAHGQLMLDGPAISDMQEQGYYQWRYEDFATMPVDYLVVMAYDNQYDNGAGTPVEPLDWLANICAWMKAKLPTEKIVIGIPSYGYHGRTKSYQMSKDTYEQSMRFPGFATATRDSSSGEMMWTQNGISYDYSDTKTLDMKLGVITDAGLTNVSVWHLGGNLWFSPQIAAPVLPQSVQELQAYYPGFDAWYQTHFQNGVYHA